MARIKGDGGSVRSYYVIYINDLWNCVNPHKRLCLKIKVLQES